MDDISTPLAVSPVDSGSAPRPESGPVGELVKGIAFRFCFVYFSLYIFFTQLLGILILLPVGDLPDFGNLPPMRWLIVWTARQVFQVKELSLRLVGGSGDRTYNWVLTFCLLVLATVATLLWSALQRRRLSYVTLGKWFRLVVRLTLGATMINYGMAKAIPVQMWRPNLARLIEPFGNFSLQGVLWSSMGASQPYEKLVGCAELLGGVLLFVPRTALLGALICLAETVQVFILNMTYDIAVKLFSFHLILFSLFLLAPEASRLFQLFVLDRPVGSSAQPPLCQSRRGNRAATVCQAIFCGYLLFVQRHGYLQLWNQYGDAAPKTPLYGIWNVTTMTIDGQLRAPLITDYDRWRRVVVEAPLEPTVVSFHRMDDTAVSYTAALDMSSRTLKLSKEADENWSATLAFQQPSAARLTLDGNMDGHRIHLQLQLHDRKNFLLVSRPSFHWITERSFNR